MIDASKFKLVNADSQIYDKKLDTKPEGFWADALRRFRKNKLSVVAFFIISFVFLFSLIGPIISKYDVKFENQDYKTMRPKIGNLGGNYKNTLNQIDYDRMLALGLATQHHTMDGVESAAERVQDIRNLSKSWDSIYNPIKQNSVKPVYVEGITQGSGGMQYKVKINSYHEFGFRQIQAITKEKYEDIRRWEKETGLPVIFPLLRAPNQDDTNTKQDQNEWYLKDPSSTGKYSAIDAEGNVVSDNYRRINGKLVTYVALEGQDEGMIRVLYYNYYHYTHGIEPGFWFGTDAQGRDVFIRLAVGIRTSLLLAILCATLMFVIGILLGTIQGYYGGWTDLIGQRLMEILSAIPTFALASILKFNFIDKNILSPFFVFLLLFVGFGWMGMAGDARIQFYRFKRRDYVLASRTLGAKDSRLMFKHILPNGMGLLITSAVMIIPGIIFGEANYAYLGILNLAGGNGSSLGSMIVEGQGNLLTAGYIFLFPTIVLSLILISFNLFGNGLRDALNPSLRGKE